MTSSLVVGRGRLLLAALLLLVVLLVGLVGRALTDDADPASSDLGVATPAGSGGQEPPAEAAPAAPADPAAPAEAVPAAPTEAAPAAPTEAAPASPTEAGGGPITLAFAGDSYAEGVLRQRLDAQPTSFVGPYADLFRSVDLTILNLETALTEGGTPLDKAFTFRAPARVLDALRAGGVDVVSLANNHGMDFGPTGLQDSIAIKQAQPDGMVIGIGEDEDEAYAPYVTEIRGHRIGVIAATQVLDSAFLESWTAGPGKPGLASAKREDRLVEEVRRWRTQLDTLAVMVHWGVEGETCPTAVQQALAQRLVEAGADIVVGGHQHRVAGGGRMDGALIHYGLGNFLFKANSAAGARTGVLVAEVQGGDVTGYRWEPGRIADSVPVPLTGAERDAALADWAELRSCTGLGP